MIDSMTPTMIKEFMREMGAKGGKARLKTMTKKERTVSASKAAKARWKKHCANQSSTQ